MNDFLISGVEDQTAGGDLSFGSSEKVAVYCFASWMASASEMALLMSTESSPGEWVMWPEPKGDGSPDILFGEGGKVLVEDMDEEGGEFIGVIKCDTTGAMSEY